MFASLLSSLSNSTSRLCFFREDLIPDSENIIFERTSCMQITLSPSQVDVPGLTMNITIVTAMEDPPKPTTLQAMPHIHTKFELCLRHKSSDKCPLEEVIHMFTVLLFAIYVHLYHGGWPSSHIWNVYIAINTIIVSNAIHCAHDHLNRVLYVCFERHLSLLICISSERFRDYHITRHGGRLSYLDWGISL